MAYKVDAIAGNLRFLVKVPSIVLANRSKRKRLPRIHPGKLLARKFGNAVLPLLTETSEGGVSRLLAKIPERMAVPGKPSDGQRNRPEVRPAGPKLHPEKKYPSFGPERDIKPSIKACVSPLLDGHVVAALLANRAAGRPIFCSILDLPSTERSSHRACHGEGTVNMDVSQALSVMPSRSRYSDRASSR